MTNAPLFLSGDPPLDSGTETDTLVLAEQAIRYLALALYRSERNQPSAARLAFEKAQSLDPTNPAILMPYAYFLAQRAEWKAVREKIFEAAEANPELAQEWLEAELVRYPDDLLQLRLKAFFFENRGHLAEALAQYNRLLELSPQDGQIRLDQALLLDRMGDVNGAEQAYIAALQQNERHPDWLAAYAYFLERQQKFAQASTYMECALSQQPGDAALQRNLQRLKEIQKQEETAISEANYARFLLEKYQDVEGATERVARALQLSSRCALAYRVRADILRLEGKTAEVEKSLTLALELEPDNQEFRMAVDAFQDEVAAFRQQVASFVNQAQAVKDRVLAASYLDQALALIPDDINTHLAYANLWLPDFVEEAEKHIQQALAADDQHPKANKDYALLLRRREHPTASDQWQKALALNPDDGELLSGAVADWIRHGCYEDVIVRLQKVPALLHSQPQFHTPLAVAYSYRGLREQASHHFHAAIEAGVADAVTHREYGTFLYQSGWPVEAEKQFQMALELNEADPLIYREYAILLQTQQRYAESLQHMEKACLYTPDDKQLAAEVKAIEQEAKRFEQAETDLAYAHYLKRQGKTDMARQAFAEAHKRMPAYFPAVQEYIAFLQAQEQWLEAQYVLEQSLSGLHRKNPILQSQLDMVKDIITRQQATTDTSKLPPLSSDDRKITINVDLSNQSSIANQNTIKVYPPTSDAPASLPPGLIQQIQAWLKRILG